MCIGEQSITEKHANGIGPQEARRGPSLTMFARDDQSQGIGRLVAIRNLQASVFCASCENSNTGMLRLGTRGSTLEVRGWTSATEARRRGARAAGPRLVVGICAKEGGD